MPNPELNPSDDHRPAGAKTPDPSVDDEQRYHCNPQSGLMYGKSSDDDERRNRGRLTLETLSCSLGRVLDLSGGGMRIETKKRLVGEVMLELLDWDERLSILTRVAWIRRCGMFRYEVGLQFMDLDTQLATKLSSIAMRHRYNRAM